jgi:O-antigen/teichoic acid export membrane protein
MTTDSVVWGWVVGGWVGEVCALRPASLPAQKRKTAEMMFHWPGRPGRGDFVTVPSVRSPDRSVVASRRTALNVGFSATAAIVGKLTTFAWTVVAARSLSHAAFGQFNLVLAVALIGAAVAEWSFDAALVQRASGDIPAGSRYLSEAVTWEALLAVPVFAACGLGVALAEHGSAVELTVIFVMASIFLDSFGDTARTAATAVQRQGAISGALVLQRFLTTAIAIPLLVAGAGIAGLAVALFVGSSIGLVAHALALRRIGLTMRRAHITRNGMRRFIVGTTTIGVSALVLAALYRVDVVLLQAFKGSTAVGDYSAAYRLFDTSLFIAFSVNGALFPLMSANRDDGAFVARTLGSGLATLGVLYLPFAALCLVDPHGLLTLLFGASFGQVSAGALRALAAAPMVFGLAYLASSALMAVRRTRGLLVAAIIAVIVNVGLNLALIPPLSGTGAAIVTTVSYLVEGALLLWLLRRVTGTRVRLMRPLLPAAGASVVFGLLLAALPLPVIAEVVVSGVVAAFVWLLLVRRWAPEQLEVILQLNPARKLRQIPAGAERGG